MSPKKSAISKSSATGQARKSSGRKAVAAKSTGKKPTGKKTIAKKSTAKKSTAKKVAAKKSTTKRPTGQGAGPGRSKAASKPSVESQELKPEKLLKSVSASSKTSGRGKSVKKAKVASTQPRRSASAQAGSTTSIKPAGKKSGVQTRSAKKLAANKSTAKKPSAKKTTKEMGTQAGTAATRPAARAASGKSAASNGNSRRLRQASDSLGSSASQPLKKTSPAVGGDYDKFRQLLLTVRQRLQGDVNMMSREALGGSDGAADNHAPIHPAEVGTHSFEQEFTLNLLSTDGDRLERIDAALEKIGEGTYGACDECGGRIPRARLEVIPDTPFCVKCATRLEV